MYERFTDRARKVMQLANQGSPAASIMNTSVPNTSRSALSKKAQGWRPRGLNLDVDLRKIRLEVEKLSSLGPDMVTMGNRPRHPGPRRSSNTPSKKPATSATTMWAPNICCLALREDEGVAAQVFVTLALKSKMSARKSSPS